MKVKLTIIAENDSPITDDLKNLAATKGNKIVNTMQKALDYMWELCKLSCDDDLYRDKLTLVSAELIDENINMTNNEKLNRTMNENDIPEDSAVKSLLGQIYDDYQNGDFVNNYPTYYSLYKGLLNWLKSEVEG